MASNLDVFVPLLGNQDTKKRIQLGADIIQYLKDPTNSIECENLGYIIDTMVAWLNSSNFKVAQNGLEILGMFADRLKEDFRHYISTVFTATVDRMGDSKDQVREQAKALVLKMMSTSSTPQYVIEKMVPAFSHKNWRVREEVLLCLQEALLRFGSQYLTLSKLVPLIVNLMGDPHSQVRDTAVATMVEIYKHVGEKVRHDLSKRQNIPATKLQTLFAKFDEVYNTGGLLPSASLDQHAGQRSEDESDSKSQPYGKSVSKRASSAPPSRRALFASKPPPSSSSSAGAADEEMFMRSFEDVPRVQLYSARELEAELIKIRDTLADSKKDWEVRVEMLKRVRSLLIGGAMDYDELYPNLRQLELPFQFSVKDLRSQVVREACITIAYLSQRLGIKADHFAEVLLPSLINLIQNSAKIMSTAGIVAIRFIIQYTHASRLIPIITSNLSSKSKDIRRTCCEFLDQLLHTWPTHTLEKHVAILQEALKKGISDADPEARAFSRKAFWGFADHFREQADSLLSSLDSSKQKMLQGELCLSNSSSNNSLNSMNRPLRSGASFHGGSVENLSRAQSTMSISRKSGIPILTSPKSDQARIPPSPLRSNSAIDLAAARRAKARAAFGTAAHLPRGSVASLPRPSSKRTDSIAAVLTSPERTSRSRTKGVSQSQPSSRSGSPSSRLGFSYHSQLSDSGLRRKSGIPTASGASRETSPSRPPYIGLERRLSGSSTRSRPFLGAGERHATTITTNSPLMAERILQQSKEAEAAMADALIPSRRRYTAFDDQSDESETSSVCSDRSFSSFGGRSSEQDVADILHGLGSIHWSERKEALLGLQVLFRSSHTLSPRELKKVTDIFTKMFMDPHTKVFTLFLETLNDLIVIHKHELSGWLYVLLTRLFIKMGTDILSSVQMKIQKILETVKESFPYDEQFSCIMKFLSDQTQTPNVKVKIALLQYLHSILQSMDPSELSCSDAKVAITKIISWTADPKSQELRKHASEVVVALFNLNTSEFSVVLGQLAKTYQDTVFKLLNNQYRRRSSTDSTSSLGMRSPPSPIMQHLHSPSSTLPRLRSPCLTPQNNSFEYDDTENLNPEDYYNSLKQTTDEIQKYSLDSIEDYRIKDAHHKLGVVGGGGVHELKDSTSQDSGISQSSVVDGRLNALEERLECSSSSDSSPTKRLSPEYDSSSSIYKNKDFRNGFERQALTEAMLDTDNIIKAGQDTSFGLIVSELNNHNTRNEQRIQALNQLINLTKEGATTLWEQHFRSVLRLLVETIGDNDGSVRALALRALCELLRRHSLRFHEFVELTLMKILEAHRDPEREVYRAAEVCSTTAARYLPPELCVRTLKPIILTCDFPVNQAAIKMLSKLVEQHPQSIILQLLPEIMPALLKAYDNNESPVRKAAVFCMVAIHGVVGDAMKPHLAQLPNSKMKLLNLYIKRAQSQSNSGSTPGSPANAPSSSSSQ